MNDVKQVILASSVRAIIAITIGVTACVQFFLEKLSQENFMELAMLALSFYYLTTQNKKSQTSEQEQKELD